MERIFRCGYECADINSAAGAAGRDTTAGKSGNGGSCFRESAEKITARKGRECGSFMEEYMRRLLEQIRCRQAREMVAEEIRNHIADQVQTNEQAGMEKGQALEAAVRDMGDPVETGLALNRIHSPRTDWRLLVLVGMISVLSVFVHMSVGSRAEALGEGYGLQHGVRIFLGYGIMLAVYHLDYEYIGKYAKRIAAFCCVAVIAASAMGIGVNGAGSWISLSILGRVSVSDLLYLYIPVYGALLYRHRGEGYRGAGKCVLWMCFPVLTLRINCLSGTVLLFLVLMAMFSAAVAKGWFAVSKRITLTVFWSVFGLFPLLGAALAVWGNYLATYQAERLKAFLGQESTYLDYARRMIMEYSKSIRLFGSSGREIMDLPGINNNYLLNFVANYYGMAAMLFIGLLLLAVAARLIHVSFGQGHPLGMMMGCGCGLFFEMVTVIDILHFFGWIPSMRLFLPFFSPEGGAVFVSYVLAGIVLSVYRYQNMKNTCAAGAFLVK